MVKQKNPSKSTFYWLLAITIADFLIPDPIPAIDEIVLTGWTVWIGSKIYT